MSINILIVDDDPVQRRLLRAAIERIGHTAVPAEDGLAALSALERGEANYGAVVLDLVMPGMDGLSVMAAMAERGLRVPVIVQTGQGGIETVVKAMRAGAFDFVVKPVSPERLSVSIDNALKVEQRETRSRSAQRGAAGITGFRDIISASPAMERVLNLARRAAASNIPVVLEGESGVGKEMIARAIQSGSDRRQKPFVTVNCGAIPENLVESILFGHEKGAFTGATEKHTGKFVEADGGTLFLDEIGDLPLDVQVKLLRAVQDGEIETVGARQATKVNCRLISATNKDLIQEVKDGRFREDLYYRLNVFPIVVPALRRRKEDVPLLVRFFVERFAVEQGVPGPLTISPETMALLTAYDWPGNIRQLENAVFRAVVLSDGGVLTPDLFPQIAAQLPGYEVREAGGGPRVEVSYSETAVAPAERTHRLTLAGGRDTDIVSEQPERPSLADGLISTAMQEEAEVEARISSVDDEGEVRPLASVEEELIRFALKFYRGQMSQVARKLGIGRSTLYRKLKDYDIDPDNPLKHVA
ncbi:MAG TPA: sigma-54 dependent transcriptional regulator [Pararhizobium sp.]|nr:sigma-54 dependent transcriptional regulator [Pararhizobium sp.]